MFLNTSRSICTFLYPILRIRLKFNTNAFLSLEKDTVQFFAVDQHFVKGYSKEISYLDPEIGLKLPCENPVLSEADRHAPFLREL